MYDTFLARSFSKHEQKKLGYGAFAACFLIALSFCTVFKPYLGPLPVLNLRLSIMGAGHKMLAVEETTIPSHKQETVRENVTARAELMVDSGKFEEILTMKPVESARMICNTTDCREKAAENAMVKSEPGCNSTNCRGHETVEKAKGVKPLCNITGPRTNFCDMKGDIRIQPSSSSVFVVSSEMDVSQENQDSWKIKPYARKEDRQAMSSVREWSVKSVSGRENIPQCTRNHSVPAVLFSTGGYSGNHFHDFTDIVVPLYLTSRPFDGEVQFLITNMRPWWINKFRQILENLSRYEILDIDSESGEVHCFPSVAMGLKRHKELSIDPSRSAHTMKDFREFLRKSYSLKRRSAIRIRQGENKTKPRLLIVSRKRTRSFTNIDRIARMARGLGFDAVVAEPSMNVQKVAELVNSCDVVMGVHGAGLTNILFLPDNAVLVQIVPLGNVEWISRAYFGEPSKSMDISYLEYKLSLKESTLIEQFPLDHVVFKDPYAFHKGNWLAFKSVYLDKQNVKLDVKRFKPTLQKALELLLEHTNRSVR
ncbi:beta-1,2-xylosyltransferase XYXT1-like isoform X2 [Punica granatum]|uniref:Beta-1,2-xylosyltransferase XYXT1-like isoform X2 n=1 Tax=Punica granatum TaxID=22663 RepID=A0A6P8BNU2_PUNGR|nr:beta-1,2-xylosyltransferase XYXT1-like isoform X2 [Punica granatum]